MKIKKKKMKCPAVGHEIVTMMRNRTFVDRKKKANRNACRLSK
jgi:hypothetical protein